MTLDSALTTSLLTRSTTSVLYPRYEGANICTWIGFKHVNYLVEEAVLNHFRDCGLPPRMLYEDYGLGLDLVDLDTRISRALHLDDTVVARVVPVDGGPGGPLAFRVTLEVQGVAGRAVSAKVGACLRVDTYIDASGEPPADLTRFAVPRLGAHRNGSTAERDGGPEPTLPTTEGNAFGWRWRIPYQYCHFNDRLHMSGYLRQVEAVVDLFLADRGISIRSLLDERRWIPVVPHSRIQILDEAVMEEELLTLFTVEDVVKNLTYTARTDFYVERAGRPVLTATGRITHGYAVVENRRDWRLVPFDARVMGAITATAAGPWSTTC
ncbi:MAG TPA: thioesterase [Micromonosporaceae bacterium]|nr:thioesterase [Micromonosporaceae bacterium]